MKSLEIENFFFTLTGCQLGVLTEKSFRKMHSNEPQLYAKIKEGFPFQLL
jgi:hypothetical protein